MENIINKLGELTFDKWVYQVFVIIFLTLLTGYIASIIIKKVAKKCDKTKNLWDDALLRSVRSPILWLIGVLGITFAVDVAHKQTQTKIFSSVEPIRDVAIILIFAWFLSSLIREIRSNIIAIGVRKDGRTYDKTSVDAISKILRASVFITTLLIILQTLGFSISGVLAFGGVGGIAIGFAAKDLLANFFGALMIYFDKPFKIGDWIRSPDRNIEGTVEDIGWRQTRIRTFDKRPLYVPNSVFSTIAVENPSRMTHRRLHEYIGVRYSDIAKLPKIIDEIKEMLNSHEEIDNSQTMIVNMDKFSASSVDFMVYTFTHTINWIKFHEIKHDILLKISDIIETNGAEIAFPTNTVHLANAIEMDSFSDTKYH